ncbi:SusD/RagB family nutrient-binding outer membrane lipoprotein [Maribellus comscasis]|uniref:SusD/RagB family nutrient-binding outer membrane lipoprotein n=1 Tax=Maribellus comscasis TaxID=2681766 RepID=A0A6I6JVM5_9BACT|nr:SusD/RagB family nutrient-binding outer membrane lipoprotein [Maribellus comscasis]QGY45158.1 SusD/RagB family nutrient-binding outer membrane lipoprotein [Maribellus comscasis]
MKKYNNILKTVGLALILMLSISSCEKWIDTDLNIDPDAPAEVPMKLMLPAIEQSYGYIMAGFDMVGTTNLWMQQIDGVVRQGHTIARYQLLPADVNNTWNSIYTEIFMNGKIMVDVAENTEGSYSPHNAGVAKVIIGATLGTSTDFWGDMPFSEGFRGDQNVLTPAFDTQEEIYDTLNVILDEAIADLGASENAVDVEGDVIYDGDVDLWKKAAYSIKARHALQLSAINGTAAYSAALAAAANGFSSNDDNLEVPWESANHNPMYQFMEQRGDVRMASTFVDMLLAQEDPRLPYYAEEDGDGNYRGSIIGSQDESASLLGTYIAGAEVPTVMMSFAELKFIEAEAYFQLGQTSDAAAAFEAGVKASVERVTGSWDQDWYDTQLGGETLTLELIMKEKYIATFGTNQAYADYRRTGLPAVEIHPDAVLSAIPTRFPYSQNEMDYNGDNVPSVTISDKLWWDN